MDRDGGPGSPVVADLDARSVVTAAAVGLGAGALAVAFRQALTLAESAHLATTAWLAGQLGAWGWPAAAALGAALGGLAVFLVDRFAPEAAGSGIPSVEARLTGDAPLRWRRLLAVKFGGGLAALATGMSLGREGPTVQLGASVGEAVADGARVAPRVRRALVAAGAGAGLTGAFDAPLAGFLFVVEELRREIDALTYGTALVAALAAQLVIGAAFGPRPLFGEIDPPPLPAAALLLVALCGAACGLLGVLYNRSILLGLDLFARWRSVPTWVHGAAAGAFAVLVALVAPDALFGGDPVTVQIVAGSARDLAAGGSGELVRGQLGAMSLTSFLALLVVAKLVLTAVSYGSGVVGGLFAPQLVLGAAAGALIGELARPLFPGLPLVSALAGCGAVAVFTASVRVPVTGVVLLLEMTGGVSQCFAFALAATAAFLVAIALRDEPIYEALRARSAAVLATASPAAPAAATKQPRRAAGEAGSSRAGTPGTEDDVPSS